MKYVPHFLLLLLVLTAPFAAAQQFTLRYSVPKDDALKYKQVEETTAMAQSNDGRSMEINRKTTRYITVLIEEGGSPALQYLFSQDTAIVEENSDDPRIQRQNELILNVLTKRPVRVRQSPTGVVESITATSPLNVQQLFGPGTTDAMFTSIAAIFPALPERELAEGVEWTDAQRDTLRPTKNHPNLGTGTGVRFTSSSTTYTVGGRERIGERDCVKISWTGKAGTEEKVIFERLEEFNEETVKTSGEMLVDLRTGVPVKIDIYADKESTKALFGSQNSVIPTSMSTHTTLELFSQ